jgi:hypothetical protein
MNKFGYLISAFNPIKKSKIKNKYFESNHKKNLDHLKNNISEKIIFKDHSIKKIEGLNKCKTNENIRKIVGNIKNLKRTFSTGNKKNNNKKRKKNNKSITCKISTKNYLLKKDNKMRKKNNKSITCKISNKNYFIIFGNNNQLDEGNKISNKNTSSKYYSLIHIDANNSSKRSQKSNIIFEF